MKTALFGFLCVICSFTIIGCRNETGFTKSVDDILSFEEGRRGTIYSQVGEPGFYKAGFTAVGNVNSAGSLEGGAGAGRVKISWPAMDACFFEGTVYTSAENGAFIVVRQVPAP